MSEYRYSGKAIDLFSAKCVKCVNGGYDDGYCCLKQDKYNCKAKLFWCQYEQLWISETHSCKDCNQCNSCFTMRVVFGSVEQRDDACRFFARSVIDLKYSIWEMKRPHMIRIWRKIIRARKDLIKIITKFALEHAPVVGIYGLTEQDVIKMINRKVGL